MFENFYLDRKACFHFYNLMTISFKIIYFLIICIFIYFLWQQRYIYMGLFETSKLMKAHDSKNWSEYLSLLKLVGMETIYFFAKIFIVSMIIKIFKNITIPSVWLKKWDDNYEIDNLFGRHLCEHLRTHKKIKLINFKYLHIFCNKELKNLKIISTNPNLNKIFNKYDSNYTVDTKKFTNKNS